MESKINVRAELIKEFEESELEWKVQSCGINNNKPWAVVVAYVKARAIQNRLDEVFGWENWTEEYREFSDNVICRLGVCIDGRWIYKENGAAQSDKKIFKESFKGGISGAFKRVASSGFGIGRYLYYIESNFAECSIEKKEGFTEKAKTKEDKIIYWKIPKINQSYTINSAQLKRLCTLQTKAGVEDSAIKIYLKNNFGIDSRKKLNSMQYEKVCNDLEKQIKIKEKKEAV